MLQLRQAELSQLALFSVMEQDPDSSPYILPTTLEQHRQNFARDEIIYLAICSAADTRGFIMLALDPDGFSLELRRIVVADKGRGTGRQAIATLENYCRQHLQRRRIWLDVFEFNQRARQVYSGLGYRQFDQGEFDGKPLLYFEKQLD